MPVHVLGFLASNSAENEWWAEIVPAAASIATATTPPSKYALISFLLRSSFTVSDSLRPIVLADVHRKLLAGHPAQIPGRRPWSSVSPRIVYSHLVFQGIEVGSRKPFDKLELLG